MRPLRRLLTGVRVAARAVRRRLSAATRPAAAPLLTGTLAGLARTKPDLLAENAFLRQLLLILGEAHLRGVLREYVAYFNTARPDQGIGQAIPSARGPAPSLRSAAPIAATPVLGGLHHTYRRAA